MTSPIKPPGGPPPGAPTPDDASGPVESGETQGPKKSFKAALDNVAAADQAQGAVPTGEIQAIADELKAGKIDTAAAVERLVARVVESAPAQVLSEAGRAALEAHIRSVIEDDPAIQAMLNDLRRGTG